MDNKYAKAESIISGAASEIRKIYESTDHNSPKNREAIILLESLVKKLEDAERQIHIISSPNWEEILIKASNGQLKDSNSVFGRTREQRIKHWDIPGGRR